ncbi:MAG TPA: VCBS repeat-containing protein, partial [Flavisolibacter sp.]|nr:VCBS repeat-containing protein [Flavisolibacter sp.]
DGKGNFKVADNGTIQLLNIGMVTTAIFTDMNHDGWSDLVIAGEWMPITIFTNNKGKFTKTEIPHSTGWWQTIFADDVNGDGKMDLLAGNWGWNNKFEDGKNSPVKLYVSDFDKNGQTDQLLSYTKNGTEYPFLAKDEMEKALPVLRKHYLLYADYAGLPMKDAFYGFAETVKPLEAERLGSVVCFGGDNGNFTVEDLPANLQLAPIFSFQKAGTTNSMNGYLAGGNFFDVIPYEGRYDAQALALFSVSKQQVHYYNEPNISGLKEQVRDIKWVKTAKGQVLVVAGNNAPLLFYGLTKPK